MPGFQTARQAGSMPGEMADHRPDLAPLPASATPRVTGAQLQRRFEAYKSRIVKPFFKDHFSGLTARVCWSMRWASMPDWHWRICATLAGLLTSFRPGRNSAECLDRQAGRRFVRATKADHIHHRQHRSRPRSSRRWSMRPTTALISRGLTEAMSIASAPR